MEDTIRHARDIFHDVAGVGRDLSNIGLRGGGLALTHGEKIALAAKKAGISPSEFAKILQAGDSLGLR